MDLETKCARVIATLGLALLPFAGTPLRAEDSPADLVLRNGRIYTVDAVRTWADAVAIRGDEIVYIGLGNGIDRYIGEATRVIDLKQRMVLPSFQDVHVHPVHAGVTYLSCSLYDHSTREEYVRAVADYAAAHPDEPWILGGGWLLDAFPNGIPDKGLLDAVVSDRPVALKSSDGHTLWVNSRALEIAGITAETPNPPGGRIDRDPETGEPNGVLQEDPGMELIFEHSPKATPAMLEEGLRYALRILNGYGITSLQDAIVKLDGNDPYRSLDTYRALDERGELTARVVAALFWNENRGLEQIDDLIEARDSYTKGNVRATSIKIWEDGVLETWTAALLEPYTDRPGTKGNLHLEPDLLNRAVTRLDAEGFQVHFHAIGDAAVRFSLDAVAASRKANGTRDARHHICHLELIDPSDIPRFRELGVVANFQPLWGIADRYILDLTLPRVGRRRGRWIYPVGSLLRSGAVVAFGSDWYVTSPNPLEEIEVAVTRISADGSTGEPFLPDERIPLADAIAAFTINAAYVNFHEDRTGSIEVGKLADLVVLDRNLFELEPAALSEVKVLLTLLGGRPVHGDPAKL